MDRQWRRRAGDLVQRAHPFAVAVTGGRSPAGPWRCRAQGDEPRAAPGLAESRRLHRPDAAGDLAAALRRVAVQRGAGAAVRTVGQGHRVPHSRAPDRTAQAYLPGRIRKPGQRHGDHAPGHRPGHAGQIRWRNPEPFPGGDADPGRHLGDPGVDALATGAADPAAAASEITAIAH